MSTNKQGIRNLLKEYFSDYDDYDSFNYYFKNKSFTVEKHEKTLHKNQKKLIGFGKNSLL